MPVIWLIPPLILMPLLISTALTVCVEGFCRRFRIFDLPGERKMQVQPVPRLGGIAFFLTSAGFAGILSLVTHWTHLVGAVIVFVGGFIDDVHPANSVKAKLAFQIPGALLFALGCPLDQLAHGTIAMVLIRIAVFGFVFFMTNATNLMDNMDGLAGALSVIITGFLATLSFVVTRNPTFAFLGTLVAASTVGFLVRNFPTGRIYMGDQGSQFLGYFISSYAVLLFIHWAGMNSQLTSFSFVPAALVLFGLYLFDVMQVVIVRLSEKRSPFVGDQCHISHRLVKYGLTPKVAVLCLMGIQIILCALSLALFPQA